MTKGRTGLHLRSFENFHNWYTQKDMYIFYTKTYHPKTDYPNTEQNEWHEREMGGAKPKINCKLYGGMPLCDTWL